MIKTKPGAVPAKTESTRQPWAPKPPGEVLDLSGLKLPGKRNPLELRHVSTDEIKKPSQETAPMEAPRHAPMQAGRYAVAGGTVGLWLDRFATSAELGVFKAAVAARMAKDPACNWKTLPNGQKIRADHVLAYCPNCRGWMWTNRPTSFCPACNLSGRLDHPGQLRPATKAETEAWFKRYAEELRMAERRSFNLRNLARQKEGFDPLTFEEWKAEQKREGERRQRDFDAIGKIQPRRPDGV